MAEVDTKDKSSYRGILKATSLFGGVQVYQILIEIIKSKIIAVLLGPEGVGVQGLYTSATHMVQNLTSFGLSQSTVRNVAEANGTGDQQQISRVVTVLRRLVWITGLLGMVTVILFSPLLSKTSFGNSDYTWAFITLSITLLLNQINAGQKVILQGTRQFKYLAKCTTIGVTIGLIVCIPLYYYWGINAIAFNIIIGSVTSLFLSWYYSRKVPIVAVQIPLSETFIIGKTMLTMGLTMSLTQFLPIASSYVLRSCIRIWDSVETVGLYSAGFLLVTQYTGLVFQAMATDFYPRLAAVNQDNRKCTNIMNQQGEIGFLLLGPLMVLCIVFIPILIRLLYSDTFLAVNDYVIWCSIGVIFKMASWAISYIFIAKAESKLFAINEVSVGIYGLIMNLMGFYLGGLTGLGISFSIKYLVYLIQVYTIAHRKYGFTFSDSFLKLFGTELCLVVLGIIIVLLIPSQYKYVIGSILAIVTIIFSYKELNYRVDISMLLKRKIKIK